MKFREFLETNEYEEDIQKTLGKLPKKYTSLVSGYKFKFQHGNTLKRDNNHIGVVDPEKKTITICAPWNYGREYTLLHEIGHLVWSTLNKGVKNKWKKILSNYPCKDDAKQSAEEYFTMAFADVYANNQISKFNIPQWHEFVKSL